MDQVSIVCKRGRFRAILCAMILGVLVCIPSAGAATTYYVSTTGNDGNDGLTPGTAWASINNGDAMGILNPGDTVMVAPGTYTPPDAGGIPLVNNAGAAGNPITYKADGSGVIIDNTPGIGVLNEVRGLVVHNSYTVIDGFEITKTTIAILDVVSTVGLEVKNCVIHDLVPQDMFPGATGVYLGGGATNSSVHHNTFYNIDGGIGTGTAVMDSTDNNTIYNNLIYNILGDMRWGKGPAGLVFRSSNNDTVYNNTIVGAWAGILAVGDIGATDLLANNNNIVKDVEYGIFLEAVPDLTGDYNLYHNCATSTHDGATPGGNDFDSDPMFVDELNDDYHLAAGSPAVNTGVDVGLPFTGPAPDRGAFETSSTVTPGWVVGEVALFGTGTPVEGATVESLTAGVSVKTLSDGSYRIPLSAGAHTLKCTFFDFIASPDEPVRTVVAGSEVTQHFVLTPSGTVYHVKTDGNDAADGLSWATAWASIDRGDQLGTLAPGDTVLVAPGVYSPPDADGIILSTGGWPDYPVTYQADGPGVIIDNTPAIGSANEVKCLNIQGSNVVIDGFELTNATAGIMNTSPVVGLEVKNCVFHDMAIMDNYPASCGIYLGGGATDTSVHHCTFYNIDGGTETGAAILDSTHDNAFYNNVIYDLAGDAGAIGFLLRSSTGDTIYNNTVVGGSAAVVATAEWGLSTVEVTNNVITNTSAHALFQAMELNTSLLSSYNVFYNNVGNYGFVWPGEGDFEADPQFVNAAAHDYHLAAGSPAINAGIDVGLPFTGPAPDCGAYETDSTVASGYVVGEITFAVSGAVVVDAIVESPTAGVVVHTLRDGSYRIPLPAGQQTLTVIYFDFPSTPDDPTLDVPSGVELTQDFVLTPTQHTYHVKVDGNDALDGLTWETAWATPNRGDPLGIYSYPAPGDTVLVAPGVYFPPDENGYILPADGAEGYPVTWQATGPGVVIDNTHNYGGPMNFGIRLISNPTYWIQHIVLDGFEVTGAPIGFYVHARNVVIRNCTVRDLLAFESTPSSVGFYIEANTSGIIVEDCVAYGLNVPGVGETAAIFDLNASDNVYRRNVVHDLYGENATAVLLRGSQNTQVYNNTGSGCAFMVRADSGASGNSVVNNIAANMSTAALHSDTNGGFTNSYNLFYNNTSNYGTGLYIGPGTGELVGDPMFVDEWSYDFQLMSGSPAINTGTDVGLAYTGPAPDRGAYETADTTALGYVAGTVTLAVGGSPLMGALVEAVGEWISAVTITDGTYWLPLEPGLHQLDATLSGFAAIPVGPTVTVTAGEVTTQDFVMSADWKAYHVKPDGNDASDGLTLETAWARINNGDAQGILNAGDIVLVEPGTYTPPDASGILLTTSDGMPGLPITYKANGPGVIIDNTPGIATPGEVRCLNVQTSYTVIDGFEITKATIGILNTATIVGLEVKNCVIHDLAPQDMFPGSTGIYLGGGATNASIHHNTFHNIDGGIGPGTAVLDSTHNNTIYNNLVYNMLGAVRWGKGPSGFILRSSTGDTFYNNTIVGAWTGIIALGEWGPSILAMNNNIVKDMSAYGMFLSDGMVASDLTGDYNLFYNCPNTYDGGIPGLNDLIADPLLDGTYHLMAGSPAIDAGIDVGLPFGGAAPDIGAFEFVHETDKIGELLADPDGVEVKLTSAVVTAASGVFANHVIYVEDESRAAGIRVIVPVWVNVAEGERVSVEGTMTTTAAGERAIEATAVTSISAGSPLGALGMPGSSVPGNAGLLVKTWGNVTYKAGDSSYFCVDDGSGGSDGLGNVGVPVSLSELVGGLGSLPDVGDYVSATGVVSVEDLGGGAVAVVRPRVASDVVIY